MIEKEQALYHFAPNFRCISSGKTYVEIPINYGKMMHPIQKELADIIRESISTMCKKYGKKTRIYDEETYHGATRPGYLDRTIKSCPKRYRYVYTKEVK